MKIATPIKIEQTEIGNMLLVRSIRSKAEVEREGKQYEWHINKHIFTKNPEYVKERLGLNTEVYNNWLKQF